MKINCKYMKIMILIYIFNILTAIICIGEEINIKKLNIVNKTDEYNINFFELKNNIENNSNAKLKLIAVGDIRFTRDETVQNINKSINQIPQMLFQYFNSKDLVIGNLEMVFKDEKSENLYNTVGKLENVKILKKLNFDAVNIANNHFQFDGGKVGVSQSLKKLKENQIEIIGLNSKMTTIKKNGIKIGILGFAKYSNNMEMLPKNNVGEIIEEKIINKIKFYKSEVDHLIIMLHWGEARILAPNPFDEDMAKKLIHAGASAIIGSGPHVIQKVDNIENGIIAYSLGNFIFDQKKNNDFNIASSKSFILEIHFKKNSIDSVRVVPIITESGVIYFPKDEEINIHKKNFEKLYQLNANEFYNSIDLYSKAKGRIILFFSDFFNNPIQAIKTHFKTVYFQDALNILWIKYRLELIIITIILSVVLICCYKLIRFRYIIKNKT